MSPKRKRQRAKQSNREAPHQRYLLLVVGLGNPGRRYSGTRHNVGFEVVDEIARCERARFKPAHRGAYRYALCNTSEGAVLLVKPHTYINNSGHTVALLKQSYAKWWDTARLLVVCDTLDLPAGTLRFRKEGGSAGHNGLKSIIATLGIAFPRLYVGIGRPAFKTEVADYVLVRPPSHERDIYRRAISSAAHAIRSAPHSVHRLSELIQGG